MCKEFKIAVLAGDGIGREVVPEAVRVLRAVSESSARRFAFVDAPIGVEAIERFGEALPRTTLETCLDSDAVLFGAIGDPRYDDLGPSQRPERALLELRRELGTYANLRPARHYPALESSAPIKAEIIRGTDLLVVRELTGGLYYGEPRACESERAFNTMHYTRQEIERIARVAFEMAGERRGKVTSVDKSNALEVSQLWRRVVAEVSGDYPDVELEHLFVDSAAMALVTRPATFDVILTENTFGDILSDEASILTGSLGLLPSASIGGRVGLYEPVHGSAPDIAGLELANPIATILSAAMLLRHSANMDAEATAIERAIDGLLEQGYGTPDIAHRANGRQLRTRELGSMIASDVECLLESSRWQV